MDVGAGIFWGLVFLGLIVLYLFTRDRWKWRKIVLRTLFGVVALGSVIGSIAFGYSVYENRVVAVAEFMGLKLSDTRGDIKFKKGASLLQNESEWAYKDRDGNWETVVKFRSEKVRMIQYVGICTYCNSLNGLGIGTNYERLIEKLGTPTFVSTSDDGLMRLVSFAKTNQFFQLAEGKVIGFGIYDPTGGPVEFVKTEPKKPTEQ